MTLTQLIKNATVNGRISLHNALKIAEQADAERDMTKVLLTECEKHVGMFLGEKINAHLSYINGAMFEPKSLFVKELV